MTEIQKVVVLARKSQGYEILGEVQGKILISKGRHIMLINNLGYDEHVPGITYKVKDYEYSEFV